LEEVAVRDGHKVLMKVDDSNLLIVGNPEGIFRPSAPDSRLAADSPSLGGLSKVAPRLSFLQVLPT
jgi:hypothetical protein